MWAYTIGRPTEKVQMAAEMSLEQKLAAEKEPLGQCPSSQLTELAAASQQLVDRAMMMLKANANALAANARHRVARSPTSSRIATNSLTSAPTATSTMRRAPIPSGVRLVRRPHAREPHRVPYAYPGSV